jgi:DNA-binding XRE family transcriptional regulator
MRNYQRAYEKGKIMNDTITISRAEFEALQAAAEELSDLQAYDRVTADLDSGRDELIPAAFADRLIGGESPLRVWRELRGLTQAGLANVAHVNRVQIADIEAGRKSGSIETIKKLAEALGIAVDDLV